jgi:23S rRNA (adenine2503-C2)-methyltransferase
MGEPPYRARQLWQWVWQKGVFDFAAMSNISKPLRAASAQRLTITLPTPLATLESVDGTIKFLLRLSDGASIETVLIPDGDRFTQCLSSQVGCPLACTFCSTGGMGFERNLLPGEILSQLLFAREYLRGRAPGQEIKNLVFMGMGEPLLNWKNVRTALETLNHPLGLDYSPRRVTVSTVGIPGVLQELGRTGLASLAVSLHAPTQDLRALIMPKAALFPLDRIMEALKEYPLKPRQRITVEYLLLDGVNDSLDHARDLVRLLNPLRCKINLIAYNPCPGSPYHPPDQKKILDFEQYLWSKGLTATLRKSKGQDISAACGQLKSERPDADPELQERSPQADD